MPRAKHPDYRVDPDRGSAVGPDKRAVLLDLPEFEQRDQDRQGLRGLDDMLEGMPGLNRLQRDRERLFPRDTAADLRHPLMRRELPRPGQVRQPLSARQRNQRSKARRVTQDVMPLVQLRAQRALVTDPGRWSAINDRLSDATGDIQSLPDAGQAEIRRIDRSIQAYERRNERGHVVYANVSMPGWINGSNADGFIIKNFPAGRRVAFDRYTQSTHQLHETRSHVGGSQQVVTFELETRRGAYLGQSDKKDNTHHLLPRGLEFEVVGSHRAAFTDRDGRLQQCLVVQLRDITPEPARKGPRP